MEILSFNNHSSTTYSLLLRVSFHVDVTVVNPIHFVHYRIDVLSGPPTFLTPCEFLRLLISLTRFIFHVAQIFSCIQQGGPYQLLVIRSQWPQGKYVCVMQE